MGGEGLEYLEVDIVLLPFSVAVSFAMTAIATI